MNPANNYGMVYIKIKPGTETSSLQYIANTFKNLFPLSPFAYNFKTGTKRTELCSRSKVETNYFIQRHTNHFYFLHWFVWIICFICRKKNKRNRHTQSIGCFCKQHCIYSFNRFFKADFYFINYINTTCMDGNKQMAAELSLSHNT